MTYEQALKVIGIQERGIRKVNGLRFVVKEYEYRLTYSGGFACYVGIDRREVGKRVFRYFGGIGAYGCLTVGQVLEKVRDVIARKVDKAV